MKCNGDPAGAEPVDILVTSKKWKKRKKKKDRAKHVWASFEDVQVGDILTVSAADAGKNHLKSTTYFKIRDDSGKLQKVSFHTSCSQPLGPGNQFGSIKLTSLTTTQGGTVTLPEDPPECVQEIDVVPGPLLGGSHDWFELALGARVQWGINERWSTALRGDFSGFGIGDASDLTYNLWATADYHPWERWALLFGYRVYSLDYETGTGAQRFGMDVTEHGPFIAAAYRF